MKRIKVILVAVAPAMADPEVGSSGGDSVVATRVAVAVFSLGMRAAR
ncbi:MAG: hypothetical protein JOZ19_13610 [Rubrobacter sp.]|nr:hypothetical protein [Rubrobacter sp.]